MTCGAGLGPQIGVLSAYLLCLLNRGAVEALVRGTLSFLKLGIERVSILSGR